MRALRVVVLEDEAMIAMLFSEVLTGLGHDVCAVVRTEDEAVAAAFKYMPDLILLDQNLPEGSGAAALLRILAKGFMPHILVSGDLLRDQINPNPVCLQKPFNEARLIEAIDLAMARRPLSAPLT